MVPRAKEEFTVTVTCPDCQRSYVGPTESIPQFCACGNRFWSPVEPTNEPTRRTNHGD